MAKIVLEGDLCNCTNGSVPCLLIVTNRGRMAAGGRKIALVTDAKIANLPTFGLCNQLANPSVAGATAAAQGVLTPMPCIPVLAGTWKNTVKKMLIDNQKAVGESSYTLCHYGGRIRIKLVGNHMLESE